MGGVEEGLGSRDLICECNFREIPFNLLLIFHLTDTIIVYIHGVVITLNYAK